MPLNGDDSIQNGRESNVEIAMVGAVPAAGSPLCYVNHELTFLLLSGLETPEPLAFCC